MLIWDEKLFFKDCTGAGSFSSNDGFGMRTFSCKDAVVDEDLFAKERFGIRIFSLKFVLG